MLTESKSKSVYWAKDDSGAGEEALCDAEGLENEVVRERRDCTDGVWRLARK